MHAQFFLHFLACCHPCAYTIKLFTAPTLPANVGLGWEGCPRTNTLAYYGNL
jgi:hypothetical protein